MEVLLQNLTKCIRFPVNGKDFTVRICNSKGGSYGKEQL